MRSLLFIIIFVEAGFYASTKNLNCHVFFILYLPGCPVVHLLVKCINLLQPYALDEQLWTNWYSCVGSIFS